MDIVTYLFFRLFVLLLWIMPFRLIYLISDIGYVLIYYVAGYRKNTVIKNLTNSFPEKDAKEIKRITKNYYKHLSDLLFEGIKGMSMSRAQIRLRHKVLNVEILDEDFKNGKSIMAVTSHYGNWEWGAYSSGICLKHKAITLYKPLSNKFMERYMKKHREKFNCTMVQIKDTLKTFNTKHPEPVMYILLADQSPDSVKRKDTLWINFLNQDTACIQGPEKFSIHYDLPVYYINIEKVKRGYYSLFFTKLCEDPKSTVAGEISRLYMKTLENIIHTEPTYWLWSHRRWKRKRIL